MDLLDKARAQRTQPKKKTKKEDDPIIIIPEEPKQEKNTQKIKTNEKKYDIKLIENYGEIQEFSEFQYIPSKRAIAESLDMYRYLMKSIIKDSDFQARGDGRFLKRSGFRKIAQAFGITLEQIGKEELFEHNNVTHARVKVRASLGHVDHEAIRIGMNALIESGTLTPEEIRKTLVDLSKMRFADGVGIVSMDEIKYDKGKTAHNLIGFAWTRAASRAIADLVGFGVVSATEIDVNDDTNEWL